MHIIEKRAALISHHNKRVGALYISIGQSLCFCSTQHFARIFRRIVGASPGEYRMRKLAQTRQAAACRHGQSHTARQ
ncbi:MAG: AraC family transcriptional regulator [Kiritimatiellae bacterium]|nr:AraC family transcriptional regulator [Kiritimatiellia bacterium]